MEVMVSSLVVLITGVGLAALLNRSSTLTGQQKTQAVAGNVAQAEQDALRAFTIGGLSNLRRTTTRAVSGTAYSIDSRADWITDQTGDADCTATGAADYLKLKTTVTWSTIGNRKPVVLESIASPPARTFGSGQGSLAMTVQGAGGAAAPFAGLSLALSGVATLTDTTNAQGCVLWGYLPVGSARVQASKAGYVTPTGASTIDQTIPVVGEQTARQTVQYDRAGTIAASFYYQTATGPRKAVSPVTASVESPMSGVGTKPMTLTGSGGSLADVFPATSTYSVYADGCTSSKPAANLATVKVDPGVDASVDVRVPGFPIRVVKGSTALTFAKDKAVVYVTSACGTAYPAQQTDAAGYVPSPGWPATAAAPGLTICALYQTNSGGSGTTTYFKKAIGVANTALDGSPYAIDMSTGANSTTPPAGCT